MPKHPPDLGQVEAHRWRCVGFAGPAGSRSYPAGREGLAAALGDVDPGDQVILEGGVYSGEEVSATRHGAADRQVVIRARDHLQARIDLRLNVDAEHCWVTGCDIVYQPMSLARLSDACYKALGGAVMVRRKGLRVTRNRIRSGVAGRFVHSAGKPLSDLVWAYNTMESDILADRANVAVLSFHSWPNSASIPPDTEIAYNVMRQMRRPSGSGDAAARVFLHLQPSKPSAGAAVRRSFRFHHNHCVGAVRDFVYIKRQAYLGYNYFESISDATKDSCTMRHGLLAEDRHDVGRHWEANRFASRTMLMVHGRGALLNGNVGPNAQVQLMSGSNDPNGGGLHDSAGWATLVDNTFESVLIGALSPGDEIDNTRGGVPDHVRFFRGDAPLPRIIPGPDVDESNYSVDDGFGGYPKVKAPTGPELLAQCGCD